MEAAEATPAPEQGAPVTGEMPQEKPKPEAPPEELPKAAEKRKYKVKVDGKELEVDEDELTKGYQIGRTATQRFQQAKKLIDQAQPYMTARQKGDLNAMLDGLPEDAKRQWAENYLMKHIELMEMDPKEREALEYKKQVEQYKKKEAEQKKQQELRAKQQKEQKLMAQAAQEIDGDIANTIKELGVKPSPRVVARIAEQMLIALQGKQARLPAKAAYEKAMSSLKDDVSNILGEMEGEQLVQTLPKEVVKKILKYHTNQVAEQSPFGKPKTAPNQAPANRSNKRMKTDDFFDKLDKKYRSR